MSFLDYFAQMKKPQDEEVDPSIPQPVETPQTQSDQGFVDPAAQVKDYLMKKYAERYAKVDPKQTSDLGKSISTFGSILQNDSDPTKKLAEIESQDEKRRQNALAPLNEEMAREHDFMVDDNARTKSAREDKDYSEAHDKTSPKSRAMQDLLKETTGKDYSDMSYADVEKLSPYALQLYKAKQKEEMTPYQKEYLRILGKKADQPKPEKDDAGWWLNMSKSALKDDRVKALFEQKIGSDSANQMLDLLRQGNTVAAASLGKVMATAMGEGKRTTDQDVVRYVQSGKLSQKAADKLSKWLNGVPSDATTQEIQEIAHVLDDQYKTKVAPIMDEYVERAGDIKGIPYEDAQKKLHLPGSSYTSKKNTTSAGGLTPEEEVRFQELHKKFGGKS